jgi:hypothetical protein
MDHNYKKLKLNLNKSRIHKWEYYNVLLNKIDNYYKENQLNDDKEEVVSNEHVLNDENNE